MKLKGDSNVYRKRTNGTPLVWALTAQPQLFEFTFEMNYICNDEEKCSLHLYINGCKPFKLQNNLSQNVFTKAFTNSILKTVINLLLLQWERENVMHEWLL